MFFSFYAKNFDNYKLLRKILSSPKEPIKEIELASHLKEDNKNKNSVLNKDINNLGPLIEKGTDENKVNIEDINTYKNINDNLTNEETTSIILNKLSFYDFFYNNFYSKCCKRRKKQEIINMTNQIIYKYLSTDSLLYNQIILENLFRDYKWNNSSLNNIQNNKMIANFISNI